MYARKGTILRMGQQRSQLLVADKQKLQQTTMRHSHACVRVSARACVSLSFSLDLACIRACIHTYIQHVKKKKLYLSVKLCILIDFILMNRLADLPKKKPNAFLGQRLCTFILHSICVTYMRSNETEAVKSMQCVCALHKRTVGFFFLSLFCYWYKMYFECFFRFDLCIDDDQMVPEENSILNFTYRVYAHAQFRCYISNYSNTHALTTLW